MYTNVMTKEKNIKGKKVKTKQILLRKKKYIYIYIYIWEQGNHGFGNIFSGVITRITLSQQNHCQLATDEVIFKGWRIKCNNCWAGQILPLEVLLTDLHKKACLGWISVLVRRCACNMYNINIHVHFYSCFCSYCNFMPCSGCSALHGVYVIF